jgi:hypothetical protein
MQVGWQGREGSWMEGPGRESCCKIGAGWTTL